MRAILLSITVLFSISSLAEGNAAKLIQVRGLVRSEGTHTNACGVSLEVIDESTGKSLDLVDAEDLEQMHCQKEQDFVATISGEITSKFLFWGGNFKVTHYEVLAEQDAIPHIVANTMPKRELFRSGEKP